MPNTPVKDMAEESALSDNDLLYGSTDESGGTFLDKKVKVSTMRKKVGESMVIYFTVEGNSNRESYRTRNIGATGAYRFTFIVPDDFLSLVSIRLIASPRSGAEGSGKDIDLISSYGADGEAINNHSESDTSSTYQIAASAGTFGFLDLSSVFTGLAAGDRCGVFVDHKAIGGSVDYYKIELKYNRA